MSCSVRQATGDRRQATGDRRQATGDSWTLIFSRDLRHPPTKVWAALTDPDQLARWAPFTASRDLTNIGDATLTMVDGDVRHDLPASVTTSEPSSLLEYSWGPDVLRGELVPIGVDTDTIDTNNRHQTQSTPTQSTPATRQAPG
jgi:uncharacterized protein YndB with AHSA1/START domain